jgi:hypothetical protein
MSVVAVVSTFLAVIRAILAWGEDTRVSLQWTTPLFDPRMSKLCWRNTSDAEASIQVWIECEVGNPRCGQILAWRCATPGIRGVIHQWATTECLQITGCPQIIGECLQTLVTPEATPELPL